MQKPEFARPNNPNHADPTATALRDKGPGPAGSATSSWLVEELEPATGAWSLFSYHPTIRHAEQVRGWLIADGAAADAVRVRECLERPAIGAAAAASVQRITERLATRVRKTRPAPVRPDEIEALGRRWAAEQAPLFAGAQDSAADFRRCPFCHAYLPSAVMIAARNRGKAIACARCSDARDEVPPPQVDPACGASSVLAAEHGESVARVCGDIGRASAGGE